MEFQTHQESGVTVIDLNGEIDVSCAPHLRQALMELFENDIKFMLINMGDVIYIDSAGLSVLIATHRKANDNGGSFGLSNLQQPVRQVLHITGIDKVMQIFPTEKEGVQTLSKM